MFSLIKRLFTVRGALAPLLVFLLFAAVPAGRAEGFSILMTFAGDCTLGSEEWLKGTESAFDRYVERFGPSYPFENFMEYFAQDDLTVVNLESVLYDLKDNRTAKNYNFRGPVSFAKILTEGSVEAAFLANNHILDYGLPGYHSTVKALEESGVAWFGSTSAGERSYIFEKNGVKVGLLGTFYSYWGRKPLDFNRTMEELWAAGCQVVVGVTHDGIEYATRRNWRQEDMARWYIRRGATLVVGHHPHLPQGMDLMGDASVLYSLGNFSFGGNKDLDISRRPGVRADRALVARVELRFDAEKNYLGHQVTLVPVSPSGTAEFNDYRPVFLSGEEALDTLRRVQDDTPFPLSPYVEGVGAVQPFVPFRGSPSANPAPAGK